MKKKLKNLFSPVTQWWLERKIRLAKQRRAEIQAYRDERFGRTPNIPS